MKTTKCGIEIRYDANNVRVTANAVKYLLGYMFYFVNKKGFLGLNLNLKTLSYNCHYII